MMNTYRVKKTEFIICIKETWAEQILTKTNVASEFSGIATKLQFATILSKISGEFLFLQAL